MGARCLSVGLSLIVPYRQIGIMLNREIKKRSSVKVGSLFIDISDGLLVVCLNILNTGRQLVLYKRQFSKTAKGESVSLVWWILGFLQRILGTTIGFIYSCQIISKKSPYTAFLCVHYSVFCKITMLYLVPL